MNKTKKNLGRTATAGAIATVLAVGIALSASAATQDVTVVAPVFGSTTNAVVAVADGDAIVVNGSSFSPGATVFVAVCDESTLGTACDDATDIEVTASSSGTFSVTIPLSQSFTAWNPHDDSTGATLTCSAAGSTACAILVVQHAGMYPYVVQPLEF